MVIVFFRKSGANNSLNLLENEIDFFSLELVCFNFSSVNLLLSGKRLTRRKAIGMTNKAGRKIYLHPKLEINGTTNNDAINQPKG